MFADFFFNTVPSDPFVFIQDCAEAIAIWLTVLQNWGVPLLNWEPGCPVLDFGNTLEMDRNGTDWFCDNTAQSQSVSQFLAEHGNLSIP